MNLAGWVRNLPDGRVETVATADDEVLVLFESALRSGPALASVSEIEAVEEAAADFDSFEVRP